MGRRALNNESKLTESEGMMNEQSRNAIDDIGRNGEIAVIAFMLGR